MLRIAPTLLLCVALFALSLVPRGLVLCVAGAHVEIEGDCELAPCDTPEQAASSLLGTAPPDRCTDTPLLLPSLRSHAEHDLQAPLAVALVDWRAARAAAPAFTRIPAADPLASEPLRGLRATVLTL